MYMNQNQSEPKLYANRAGEAGFYHKIALLIAGLTIVIAIGVFILSWIKYEYTFYVSLIFGVIIAIAFYFISLLVFAFLNVMRRHR